MAVRAETRGRLAARTTVKEQARAEVTTGAAAAAMIAAGAGSLIMGVVTTLSEVSTPFSNSLNLYNPVGPLSGKTILTVIGWLLSWVLLGAGFKNKNANLQRAFAITMVLIVLGFALTFPPVFELIKGG